MSKRLSGLWHQLDAWRQRQRARRQELRQQRHEQQRLLWGGPVEADRVLAFSDAIFAIAITLLTLNLQVRPGLHGADFTRALHQVLPALGAYALSFVILGQLWLAHHRIFGVIARVDYAVLVRNLVFLGLIAIMPFPVRLLSDYSNRPLAVAIYAVAFITAMQLQRLIWLDVTRPEHRDLLREPVPDEVRTGFGRVLLGLLVLFGAAVPVGMFAPRYATLVWVVIIPLRLLVARLTKWPSWRPTGTSIRRVRGAPSLRVAYGSPRYPPRPGPSSSTMASCTCPRSAPPPPSGWCSCSGCSSTPIVLTLLRRYADRRPRPTQMDPRDYPPTGSVPGQPPVGMNSAPAVRTAGAQGRGALANPVQVRR